jgi:hypothetical protein
MLPTLSEITFAALLGESVLKVKPIFTTTNSPDNNPSGYGSDGASPQPHPTRAEAPLPASGGPVQLLARGFGRGTSPGSADGSHLSAASASAEEPIAAIGFQSRNTHSRRHLEALQDLSRSRIDSPQIALVILPGAVPELSVNPGDPGDETAGFDGAKNRPRLGIDLMDLSLLILPHPKRPFGPREPRVTAAGRWNRGEHLAGLWIDLLDAILGDLKQVPAVEGRSRISGDINRAHRLSARRIEGAQLLSGSKPNLLTVIGDPIHPIRTRKRSILTNDFSR